jgi:hypothetical protein
MVRHINLHFIHPKNNLRRQSIALYSLPAHPEKHHSPGDMPGPMTPTRNWMWIAEENRLPLDSPLLPSDG